ncbi:translation initiation factor 2 [Planosporangium sp. 12N6]|uniref:translation initiation factor 2 n=1 Tax=Planosporangium spinosum TaxID=3402278 RepID=UPI003CEB1D84
MSSPSADDRSGPQSPAERPGPYAGPGPQTSPAGRPGPGDDADAQWRRPDTGTPSLIPPPGAVPAREPVAYTGPPPTNRPPAGWRPRLVVQAPPPRRLPAQDPPAMDEAEQRARTVTLGVALVGGAVMIVLMLVLCGRALFL